MLPAHWIPTLCWYPVHRWSIQFSCIVTADGVGRCKTIHTVKIVVHPAEGCCTANTMAILLLNRRSLIWPGLDSINPSYWISIHSLLFLIWKFFSAWCKDTGHKFERQVIFRTAVTKRQYKNPTAVSNRQIKDPLRWSLYSLQLRNVNTMIGEWSVIVAFIMVKKW